MYIQMDGNNMCSIFLLYDRSNDYSHIDAPPLPALSHKFESAHDVPFIEDILDNLADSKIKIRNLTFFMALMYMDHIANENEIYATTNRALKIYAGCLTVAAKMDPSQEIDREALANAFSLTTIELTEAVECVLECFPDKKDLNIDTNLMKQYISPLMFSRTLPMLGGARPPKGGSMDNML